MAVVAWQESLGLLGEASQDLGTPSERHSDDAGAATEPGAGHELDALRGARPAWAGAWGGAATPASLLSSVTSTEDALGRPFSPAAVPSAGARCCNAEAPCAAYVHLKSLEFLACCRTVNLLRDGMKGWLDRNGRKHQCPLRRVWDTDTQHFCIEVSTCALCGWSRLRRREQ